MAHGKPQGLGRCGSYELLAELATGGMATVYLARSADARDAPFVAIKRPHRHLAKDAAFLAMLVDEARLASAIAHEHVVRVRELGFESGEPFVVMDYVEGASLAEVRRELSSRKRTVDPRIAVRIAIDALAGLQAAHVLHDENGRHLGIVHRDVSPHNVLVGCDGCARLTDFGIAKAADRVQVTQTHELKGKLAYLAPERVDKRRICSPQSDVFSMAVVLWECVAGRRLFRGDEAIGTLQEVLTAPIPSLRRLGVPISAALDAAIARGLARELEVRYASAAEFGAALEAAAGEIGTRAEVVGLVEALFGERLRVRHDVVRAVLGDEPVRHALEVSGLRVRPEPTPEMRARELRQLENVAPPAPSARYVFGHGSDLVPASPVAPTIVARFGRPFFVGAALMLIVALPIVARRARARTVGTEVTPPPATSAPPRPRRIVVPLPFRAARVTLDDDSRTLEPPADVVAFDVAAASAGRHSLTAVAPDGTRAEGFVVERDGIARPESDGGLHFETIETYEEPAGPVIELADERSPPRRRPVGGAPRSRSPEPVAAPTSAGAAKPIGTVKNGFTKLR